MKIPDSFVSPVGCALRTLHQAGETFHTIKFMDHTPKCGGQCPPYIAAARGAPDIFPFFPFRLFAFSPLSNRPGQERARRQPSPLGALG